MDDHFPEQREGLWRRKLSAAERAELRAQPELELEARLTEALAQLPDSPVPSNFTARVLEAIDLEEARMARSAPSQGWRWSWHSLLPRVAVTCAVLLFAGFGLQHHELARHRIEMARSLSVVATASAVPSLDALENLDAIQRMSQPARADTELLAALQ
jgi:negative regulator of sigma E activity